MIHSVLRICLALLCCWPCVLGAMDQVTIKRNGVEQKITGRIEVEAVDGGVLLLAQDGELWLITAEELVGKQKNDTPFQPLAKTEMNKRLLAQHPGFKLHQTAHYTICYNTSPAYAHWVGSLYERLYDGFHNFWEKRGFKLKESTLPLVAVVFDSRERYDLHARRELGEAAGAIIGYYSLQTNRVIMYDLTGVEGAGIKAGAGGSAARINTILSQPGAERNVATIVHEATHQLCYNSGLQTRYADIPFWVSEGLAMYFETPDLESAKGWKRIGGVNRFQLLNFHKSLADRPANALTALLTEDRRFRDPEQATAAYSEAWAWNYFLLKTRGEDYARYLQQLAEMKPLVALEPAERVEMFQRSLGTKLETLQDEFLKFMRTVE